ncbi:MAG: hypothetical protein ACOC5T_02235 [Elusimicrobiota bacterium]
MIKQTKIDFEPLFRKGDYFKIVRTNKDPDLMPIEARRLKDGKVYGFWKGELETLLNLK